MMTSASRAPSASRVWTSAERGELARDERRRADHADRGAERAEGVQVRAADAAVQQVTDDRDGEPGDLAAPLANRQQVEERLRRVLVAAVAGVDDRTRRVPREQLWRARHRMAEHDRVGPHRLEVPGGVDERLALARARAAARDVDRIGREPLGRDLERRPRARAALVEQVDDGLAPQRRHLLDVALRDLLERRRRIEQRHDALGGHSFESEQVTLCECHSPLPHALVIRTSSTPSASARRTATSS
jgi:hypothetical protein